MKHFFLSLAILLLSAAGLQAQPPKVPEKIVFAGQTIRFDDPWLYERMDRELLTFTYMHSSSTLMLKRSSRYFPQVEPILKEYGIPDDLKYLMVIESNLDPTSVSVSGAAGLWQFMTATAREYGLEVNANVDERYNIEKSTIAACKYLQASYEKYGDWMSVAASYNAGPAAITRRLEEQHADSAMDLWMNEETSRYMFRVLAAKMLFLDYKSFGFDVPPSERYQYYPPKEIVTVTDTIEDLVAFAEEHGVTYAQLKRANLWMREAMLKDASHRTYKIIIPSK